MRNFPVTLATIIGSMIGLLPSNGWLLVVSLTCGFLHSWVLMDAKRESKSTLVTPTLGEAWSSIFLLSCTWLDIPQVQQEIHLCILNLYIHTWKWWICHCQFVSLRVTRDSWNEMGVKKVSPRKPPQTSWNSTFESLISNGTKKTQSVQSLNPLVWSKRSTGQLVARSIPFTSLSIVWTKLPPTKKSLQLQQPAYSSWWL